GSKLCMPERSRTVITYVPAFRCVTFLPLESTSVSVKPGPTVAVSFAGVAALDEATAIAEITVAAATASAIRTVFIRFSLRFEVVSQAIEPAAAVTGPVQDLGNSAQLRRVRSGRSRPSTSLR